MQISSETTFEVGRRSMVAGVILHNAKSLQR